MKKLLLVLASAALISGPVYADAQAVYDKHCKACHDAALGGAPKPGDKAAWSARIATGADAMLATVKKGKGAMPPKGTCMSCDDAALAGAIDIFVKQAQ